MGHELSLGFGEHVLGMKCVFVLSVDGMKPKMEETLASLSEPKWHESDLISLREVSQQQAWRTAVCGGATRIRPQKYLG